MPNLSMSRPDSSEGGEHGRTGAARTAGWLPAGLAAGAMIALALGVASVTLASTPSPITIASGVDTVTYSIPSIPRSGTAATIAVPNSAWHAAIGGSQWINTTGNDADPYGLNRTTRYEATFNLPAFSAASITVQVLADNAATVYLNGTQIGQQPQSDYHPNYQAVSTFTWSTAATPNGFNVGPNTLRIDNRDFGVASGIDFLATVSYAAPIPVTVSFTADDRQYDGTTEATISSSPACTLDGVTEGDDVTCVSTGATATVDTKHVGTDKPVTGSGFTLGGPQAWRYTIASASATASISQAPLTVTAATNTKDADGGTSALAVPTVTSGTVFPGDDTIGRFTETYGDALAGYPKTLTPAGVVNDGNGGLNYLYTYVADLTGRIRPGPVASLTFTAQPIDTKTGTPIYDTCVPGGNPCAASSAPVQVTARDQYLNLAGPGAPGADGTTAAIFVVIHKDNLAGGTLGPVAGTATSNGVASFGNALTIPGSFIGTTSLFATPASGPSTASTTSASFQIVNDLEACTGLACSNLALTGPQATFGRIVPGSSTLDGVTLTTQYLPTNVAKCIGQGTQVGATTDVSVQGFGVTSARPKFTVALIIPKATLQALHITSRNADSFNVCLGTTWQGGGEAPPPNSTVPVWRQKQIRKNVPLLAQPDTAPSPDVYWGWLPNCSSSLPSTNPCITDKTKEAHELQDALGLSNAEFAALGFHNGDLAIVWTTQTPWDAKGSIF